MASSMPKRIITSEYRDEDAHWEENQNLRPSGFSEYIGQEKVKNQLKIYIQAAKMRGEPLDHVLLYGPPGLGKTTLANIIAREMNSSIKTTSGPAIERAGDMAAVLNEMNHGDILFIDEIHRLNRMIEEVLYPAMEDFALDIMIGKGPGAKSVRLDLPKFTLVGATTRIGLLSAPLRDRFGVIHRLETYSAEDLTAIVKRSGQVLKCKLTDEGALEIARRSRGTPRIANRLLRRVRDYATVERDGVIDYEGTNTFLDFLEVDKMGLDQSDRNLLMTVISKYEGGPVGLDTLAVSLGEDSSTIEDVMEPYLIQLGFLARTPRGRTATQSAYEYMNQLKT